MAKKAKNKRGAFGAGTIRQKTVQKDGKTYSYWEARYTTGYDPGTGRQIQKSITGKTQREVSKKLREATTNLDNGTYIAPNKMTVGEWLDTWSANYLGGVKPFTVVSYKGQIENHIKPAIGAIRLDALNAHIIQCMYNDLQRPKGDAQPLSPKSIKNVHGVLHKALNQAVAVGYLRFNPSDACVLPRVVRKQLAPFDENQSKAFLHALKGHPMEDLFTVTLFTGMREGEVLGLLWECVDFEKGTILIDKQLQREKKKNGAYIFAPLKNDRARTITPAPWVMELLKRHQIKQEEQKEYARELWEDSGLVFTNEIGHHLATHTVYREFKRLAASIGCPEARVHDLRHSYAVAAIRSGDDIKTVQGNLGHATAAFTLDVYGHVTDQMKQASAARMESYINDILKP